MRSGKAFYLDRVAQNAGTHWRATPGIDLDPNPVFRLGRICCGAHSDVQGHTPVSLEHRTSGRYGRRRRKCLTLPHIPIEPYRFRREFASGLIRRRFRISTEPADCYCSARSAKSRNLGRFDDGHERAPSNFLYIRDYSEFWP